MNAPAPRPTWRGRLAVLLTSLTLLVIACNLPALFFKRSSGDMEVWSGIQILLLGWMGILVKQMAWYANPVMFLSLIFLLFRRWLAAAIIALIALVLAANTLSLFAQEIPADESNVNQLLLLRLGLGFYFWVASMMVVVAGAISLRLGSRAIAAGHLVG